MQLEWNKTGMEHDARLEKCRSCITLLATVFHTLHTSMGNQWYFSAGGGGAARSDIKTTLLGITRAVRPVRRLLLQDVLAKDRGGVDIKFTETLKSHTHKSLNKCNTKLPSQALQLRISLSAPQQQNAATLFS